MVIKLGKENFFNRLLSRENLDEITDDGERKFAKAVLSHDHLELRHQIPVGGKVIDFEVKNTRAGASDGKLVEVTISDKDVASHRKQKKGQMQAMKDSGRSYTVLYGENLDNLSEGTDLDY